MDEGKLWSLIRNVLTQGGAIQLDRASMSSYEEYSARLDAAAAERVADFTKLADARIAELEREIERLDAQWRDELRIYRETEDVRIAELVDLLTECRDCVASDINHTLAQFHEPAAVDYLHALLMRVDAALARAGNGGGV